MNWFIRTKLALTEVEPLVKPYDEARWPELFDARTASVESSLVLLEGLHAHGLDRRAKEAKIVHPDRGVFVLDATLSMHV